MISWTSATDGPSVGPILSTTHVGSGFVELNPTHGPNTKFSRKDAPPSSLVTVRQTRHRTYLFGIGLARLWSAHRGRLLR